MSDVAEEDLDDYSDDLSAAAAPDSMELATAEPAQTVTVQAQSEGVGARLDRFLASLYPRTSRSSLQRWIAEGQVVVHGNAAKPSYLLKPGDIVAITPPTPVAVNAWSAQAMSLDIVFEDADVMVVNKPAGLVVHPAAGHSDGTLVNGLIAHYPEIVSVARAGIVHRLDKDTSGLMVAAKTTAAQFSLVQQLQARTVKREYLALAWGLLDSQRVETLMGRDPNSRQRMAVLLPVKGAGWSGGKAGAGKEAITEIKRLKTSTLFDLDVTLVRCALQTGRTHQIRVHLEYLKHPIVADRTYSRHAPSLSKLGDAKAAIEALMPGQALHAQRLSFVHPSSGKTMAFAARPPEAFCELLRHASIAESAWA